MPVVRIQSLRTEGLEVAKLLSAVSVAVADAFGIDSAQCWTCFTEIRAGEFLEGGRLRGLDGENRHSPLVTISAYVGRSDEEISSALDGVAAVVVASFGLEQGDVFVEYHELLPGRVHTGGSVR